MKELHVDKKEHQPKKAVPHIEGDNRERQELVVQPAEKQETIDEAGIGFPIVGIGASAGGLVAFEAFFPSMPADDDPGMAFILVQHLDPDHKSILSDLIKRYTRMQVYEVKDGMEVQPNCTYIIPPGRDMAYLGGAFSCWSRPHRAGSACSSISFFDLWPRTCMNGPSASFSPVPEAMVRRG